MISLQRSVVDLDAVRNPSPIVHSILALILLMAATPLGVYRPFGIAIRKTQAPRTSTGGLRRRVDISTFSSGLWHSRAVHVSLGMTAIGIVLLVVLLHLLGGGLPRWRAWERRIPAW